MRSASVGSPVDSATAGTPGVASPPVNQSSYWSRGYEWVRTNPGTALTFLAVGYVAAPMVAAGSAVGAAEAATVAIGRVCQVGVMAVVSHVVKRNLPPDGAAGTGAPHAAAAAAPAAAAAVSPGAAAPGGSGAATVMAPMAQPAAAGPAAVDPTTGATTTGGSTVASAAMAVAAVAAPVVSPTPASSATLSTSLLAGALASGSTHSTVSPHLSSSNLMKTGGA